MYSIGWFDLKLTPTTKVVLRFLSQRRLDMVAVIRISRILRIQEECRCQTTMEDTHSTCCWSVTMRCEETGMCEVLWYNRDIVIDVSYHRDLYTFIKGFRSSQDLMESSSIVTPARIQECSRLRETELLLQIENLPPPPIDTDATILCVEATFDPA